VRNRSAFILHAVDHANDEDQWHLWRDIDTEDWLTALREAQPGQVSPAQPPLLASAAQRSWGGVVASFGSSVVFGERIVGAAF